MFKAIPAEHICRFLRVIKLLIRNTKLWPIHSFVDDIRCHINWVKVRNYTLMRLPRLRTLFFLTKDLDKQFVAGEIVECGTWNGGSAAVMAKASHNSPFQRSLWLFDSFQGFPNVSAQDSPEAAKRVGDVVGSPSKVLEVMHKLGIDLRRVNIVPGWFEDTLPCDAIRHIALLHIDADLYQSTKLALETFYPRVAPAGIVVLDDYKGRWVGVKAAADEFFDRNGIDSNGIHPIEGGAVWFQKPLRWNYK